MCCAAQSVHSQDLSPADDANAVLLWSQREREKKINKYFSSSSSSFSLLDYKTWRKHNNTNKTKKKKNSEIAAIFFLVCPPLLLVYNNNNIPNCNTAVMAVADRPGNF
jgi:hypothetical protein